MQHVLLLYFYMQTRQCLETFIVSLYTTPEHNKYVNLQKKKKNSLIHHIYCSYLFSEETSVLKRHTDSLQSNVWGLTLARVKMNWVTLCAAVIFSCVPVQTV